MLVKSALLNLEVQYSSLPLPPSLPPLCLSVPFSASFTHLLCHTLSSCFSFSPHVPVNFKVSDVFLSHVMSSILAPYTLNLVLKTFYLAPLNCLYSHILLVSFISFPNTGFALACPCFLF